MIWTDAINVLLADVYVKFNVPSDQIASDDQHRENFWEAFATATGLSPTPDELVKQAIRLRKNGKLPRLTKRKVKS